MRSPITFRKLRTEDLLELEPQQSQREQYGQPVDLSWEEASGYAAGPYAWAAEAERGVIACMGVAETFAGAAGLAWALFAEGVSLREMAQLTRFAADVVIGENPLPRIEAVVRCANVEALVDRHAGIGSHELLGAALMAATPQVRWARSVGLEPLAVLRKFGAANQTHMLLERIL